MSILYTLFGAYAVIALLAGAANYKLMNDHGHCGRVLKGFLDEELNEDEVVEFWKDMDDWKERLKICAILGVGWPVAIVLGLKGD